VRVVSHQIEAISTHRKIGHSASITEGVIVKIENLFVIQDFIGGNDKKPISSLYKEKKAGRRGRGSFASHFLSWCWDQRSQHWRCRARP
jgi:hypothetical protein